MTPYSNTLVHVLFNIQGRVGPKGNDGVLGNDGKAVRMMITIPNLHPDIFCYLCRGNLEQMVSLDHKEAWLATHNVLVMMIKQINVMMLGYPWSHRRKRATRSSRNYGIYFYYTSSCDLVCVGRTWCTRYTRSWWNKGNPSINPMIL